ncbi:proline-rich protein 2-like [Dromiciops gliroides]|uniref:proline-rich protein 2-like n=1 Tax=Dromiciops gliroides TaxID=33562 RepID=UPI001CC6BFFC|nr:proline-rich protein 2-like [Dromiciops gliroides]
MAASRAPRPQARLLRTYGGLGGGRRRGPWRGARARVAAAPWFSPACERRRLFSSSSSGLSAGSPGGGPGSNSPASAPDSDSDPDFEPGLVCGSPGAAPRGLRPRARAEGPPRVGGRDPGAARGSAGGPGGGGGRRGRGGRGGGQGEPAAPPRDRAVLEAPSAGPETRPLPLQHPGPAAPRPQPQHPRHSPWPPSQEHPGRPQPGPQPEPGAGARARGGGQLGHQRLPLQPRGGAPEGAPPETPPEEGGPAGPGHPWPPPRAGAAAQGPPPEHGPQGLHQRLQLGPLEEEPGPPGPAQPGRRGGAGLGPGAGLALLSQEEGGGRAAAGRLALQLPAPGLAGPLRRHPLADLLHVRADPRQVLERRRDGAVGRREGVPRVPAGGAAGLRALPEPGPDPELRQDRGGRVRGGVPHRGGGPHGGPESHRHRGPGAGERKPTENLRRNPARDHHLQGAEPPVRGVPQPHRGLHRPLRGALRAGPLPRPAAPGLGRLPQPPGLGEPAA